MRSANHVAAREWVMDADEAVVGYPRERMPRSHRL